MCKHVAAVLYGIGARLDEKPELLFALRKVDEKDLITRAGSGMSTVAKPTARGKILDESQLSDIFGIELAQGADPGADRGRRRARPTSPAPRSAPPSKPARAARRSETAARRLGRVTQHRKA